MSSLSAKAAVSAGIFLLVTGVLYLGFGVDRMDFLSLFGAFLVAFSGYLLLVRRPVAAALPLLIWVGIGLRVALVFAFPLLSDDVYRFIWDGHLVAAGINPFAELPAYYLQAGHEVPGLTEQLFERLNSPEYYTIYPPVAQAVFTVAAWLSPGSWYGAAVIMKLALLVGELGSLWVLQKLLVARPQVQGEDKEQYPPVRLLYYWLNPLILVEIMGNLHFEGAMVFFLLLTYYFLQRSSWVRAGVAMAAAVASKLLPLMLLPFLVRRLIRRPAGHPPGRNILADVKQLFSRDYRAALRPRTWPFWPFSLAFACSCLAFFLPFFLSADFLEGFRSSLELYQRKFEFNASLYYLARAYGYFDVGWNQIAVFGPLLARLAAGGILLLALLDRRSDWHSLAAGWLGAFTLYLLCATTVHPWYLSVPIALCVFTRWRFPLVWSFLIMLTYTNYLTVPYAENLWLVAVEYLIVAGFGYWEWRRCRRGTAVA